MERQNLFADELAALREAREIQAAQTREDPTVDQYGLPAEGLPSVTQMLWEGIKPNLPSAVHGAFDVAGAAAALKNARTGAQLGGTVAGPVGAAGGALGGAVGTTMLATALGGGAGEATKQILAGEGTDVDAMLRQMMLAVTFHAGGEVVGTAAQKATEFLKGSRKTIEKLRRKKELNPEEMDMLVQLQKELDAMGYTLTPAQLVDSNTYKTVESIASQAFTSKNFFSETYKNQGKFITKQVDDLITGLGDVPRKEIGEAYNTIVADGLQALQDVVGPQIDEAAKKAGNMRIPMSSIVEISEELNTSLSNRATVDELTERFGENSPALKYVKDRSLTPKEVIMVEMSSNPSVNTLEGANRILKTLDSMRVGADPATLRDINIYYDKIEQDIAGAFFNNNKGEAYEQWKRARKVYRESRDALLVDSLAVFAQTKNPKGPEFLAEEIFKHNGVTLPAKAFAAIDESVKRQLNTEVGRGKAASIKAQGEALKNNLRSSYLSVVLTGGTRSRPEYVIPNMMEFQRKLNSDKAFKESFEAMTTPEIRSNMKKLLQWTSTLDKRTGGNFSLAIKSNQIQGGKNVVSKAVSGGTALVGTGAMVATGSMIPLAGALTLVAAPEFIARAATKGKVTNKLIAELDKVVPMVANPESYDKEEVVKAGLRLTAILNQYGVDTTGFDEDSLPLGVPLHEKLESQLLREQLGMDPNERLFDD